MDSISRVVGSFPRLKVAASTGLPTQISNMSVLIGFNELPLVFNYKYFGLSGLIGNQLLPSFLSIVF